MGSDSFACRVSKYLWMYLCLFPFDHGELDNVESTNSLKLCSSGMLLWRVLTIEMRSMTECLPAYDYAKILTISKYQMSDFVAFMEVWNFMITKVYNL